MSPRRALQVEAMKRKDISASRWRKEKRSPVWTPFQHGLTSHAAASMVPRMSLWSNPFFLVAREPNHSCRDVHQLNINAESFHRVEIIRSNATHSIPLYHEFPTEHTSLVSGYSSESFTKNSHASHSKMLISDE